MKAFWSKLDSRQQKLIIFAFLFVAGALMLETVIVPFHEAKSRLDKSISSYQKKCAELALLDEELTAQQDMLATVKKNIAARGNDFTLFSLLEKKAQQADIHRNIKSMNSAKGLSSASFEESLIDMKLEKITIKQLADFLVIAESPADLIRIKKITISKMKESPEYLSAQLLFSSLQPLTPGKGP